LPDERGEEGEDRPTDEDAERQGPEEAMDDRASYLDEPVRVTPVKVVRWVPKPSTQPPETGPGGAQGPGPQEGVITDGDAPFDVVEDGGGGIPPPLEAVDGPEGPPAPFEVVGQPGEETAPFEVVGGPEDSPAPFEVVDGDHGPSPSMEGDASFQVAEDPGLVFTEVVEGEAGDGGGTSAPFEEEIEMKPALELRDEESANDQDVPPRRRPDTPPAPRLADEGVPSLARPPGQPMRQAPPRTVTGIPMATVPRPPSGSMAPARPAAPQPTRPTPSQVGTAIPSPKAPPPKAVPTRQSPPEEPGYAKYFRPDEDAIRPRDQGPPSGFDRDLETEAGETDIGIELDRPADKWKRDKASSRRPSVAKKPGQRTVGGRDMDAEVGTRDVGPDIGVSFERKKRRRL
jgi:hypothetical protein